MVRNSQIQSRNFDIFIYVHCTYIITYVVMEQYKFLEVLNQTFIRMLLFDVQLIVGLEILKRYHKRR